MNRIHTAVAIALGLALPGTAAAFSPTPAASPETVAPRTAVPPPAVADPASDALARALRELAASNAVWKENDADYHRQRKEGKLSAAETGDYAAYVAELKRQVLVDCEKVRRLGGEAEIARYDCAIPPGSSGVPQVASLPPDPGAVKTRSEAAGRLDDQLRRIEADLDRLTRKTEEDARRRTAPASAARGSGGGQGGQSGVNGTPGAGGTQPSAESASKIKGQKPGGGEAGGNLAAGGAASPGEMRGQPGVGGGEARRQKPLPSAADSNPGSGTGDDVVARQLREAAEKEPDPELKKKLWDEYRKYKEAQR